MPLDLLDACDWNHQLANFAFLGTSVTGGVAEHRDAWMTHCGFPAREFNTVFLKQPGIRHEETLARGEQYFQALSLPYVVRCRSDLEHGCAKLLDEAGYLRESKDTPVMLLPSIPEAPPTRGPGVEVSIVDSEEELAVFQKTALEGFGFPGEAGKLFLTSAFQALPNVQMYLGRVDGEPVATSALVATGPVAGIYWVATLESHRGRGLGAALTWAAVCGGNAFGCNFANLQASEMGRPVYERMGFETPVHYVAYAKPAVEATQS